VRNSEPVPVFLAYLAMEGFMASADLRALQAALSSGRSMRPYVPEDREADAAKRKRLRNLRLAKEAETSSARVPVRAGPVMTRGA
jgi:hypothetical protein